MSLTMESKYFTPLTIVVAPPSSHFVHVVQYETVVVHCRNHSNSLKNVEGIYADLHQANNSGINANFWILLESKDFSCGDIHATRGGHCDQE